MIICGSIAAACAIFGFVRCRRFRCRDIAFIKSMFRCVGVDGFDDFEVMILVHEATFTTGQKGKRKTNTFARITAGMQVVKTDENSKGIFQQPLTILVEQGTSLILVELCDHRSKVLATLKLDPVIDILQATKLPSEQLYSMKQKSKDALTPKIKLSMVLDQADDMEAGLLADSNLDSETGWLVRQQLQKAKGEASEKGENMTDFEVMMKSCCGPLDVFEGLGKTDTVYAAVVGPPLQRKYVFAIWASEREYELKAKPVREVEILRIRSIQADPDRGNVFLLSYFDKERVSQRLNFRRIDRARDVWVNTLQILVKMLHAKKKRNKQGHGDSD